MSIVVKGNYYFHFAVLILFLNCFISNAQQQKILWQQDLFDENSITYDKNRNLWIFPILGDVDGDLKPEVILGLWGGTKNIIGKKVMVLDGMNGITRWEYELGNAMLYSINLIQDQNSESKKLIVGSYDGYIYIFSAKTGTLLKKVNHGDKIRQIVSADINNDSIIDYVIVGDWTCMAAYDGATEKRLWETHSKKNKISGPVINDIDSDGSMEVIFGYNGNEVIAINAKTGKKKWVKNFGKVSVMLFFSISNVIFASPVIVDINGKIEVVVGTGSGEMIALDPNTGKQLKKNKLSEADEEKKIDGSINNISIGDLNTDSVSDFIIVSNDHKVYGINGKNLERLWEYKTGNEIYGSPALADMNNDNCLDVVVISNDDNLYCINGKDGTLIWKCKLGSNYDSGYALLADVNGNGLIDVIVSGSLNGKLLVLETEARCRPNEILWAKWGGNNKNTAIFGDK